MEFAGTLSDFLRQDLRKKYPDLMKHVGACPLPPVLLSPLASACPSAAHLCSLQVRGLLGLHWVDDGNPAERVPPCSCSLKL